MGEISKQDSFGKAIIDTVKRYNLQKVLEIGSWDGTGSTACFIEGMKDLESPNLTCIEPLKERYDMLVNNVKMYSWVKPINTTSVGYDKLACTDFEDVWDSEFNNIIKDDYPNKKEIVREWFDRDIQTIKSFKTGYLDNNQELWDGVLLDGSEFTGYSEFLLLKGKVNVFFLDDYYRAFKTRQVAYELEKSGDWTVVAADRAVRNGFAILIKNEIYRNNTTR